MWRLLRARPPSVVSVPRWEKWRGGGELWTRHFFNYFLFGCVSSHPVRTTGISQWYHSLRVNVQHTRLTSTPRSIFPLYFTRGQQIGENKKHEILLKSVKMKNSIINASAAVFSVFFYCCCFTFDSNVYLVELVFCLLLLLKNWIHAIAVSATLVSSGNMMQLASCLQSLHGHVRWGCCVAVV